MDNMNIDVNEIWKKATDVVDIDGVKVPSDLADSYKKLKETEKEIESRVVTIDGIPFNKDYEKEANLILELRELTDSKGKDVKTKPEVKEEAPVVASDEKVIIPPAPEQTQLIGYEETPVVEQSDESESQVKADEYVNPFTVSGKIDEPTEQFEFVFPDGDLTGSLFKGDEMPEPYYGDEQVSRK